MSVDKYSRIFKNNKNIKYIEYGTFRPCFWNTPYNPHKFINDGYLIICKPDTVIVKYKDLPLLKYYDRNMKLHSIYTTRNMFKDCKCLTRIGKESNKQCIWNLEHVCDMSDMFSNCCRLKGIYIKFKVHNVINMSGMFNNCHSLEYINTSLWNTGNTLNMPNASKRIDRNPRVRYQKQDYLIAEYIPFIAMILLFLLIAFALLI